MQTDSSMELVSHELNYEITARAPTQSLTLSSCELDVELESIYSLLTVSLSLFTM